MKETKKQNLIPAEKSQYNCPICKGSMFKIYGNQLHPGDEDFGITVFCNSRVSGHPQEVAGHGKNEARANEVVLAKFTGTRIQHDSVEDEPTTEAPKETTKQREVVAVEQPVKRGRGRPAKRLKVVAAEAEELPL